MNFLCFINLATSLAYFLLEQVDARGVVSMEISRSAPVGGANMAQAYDTDRQNIPSKEIAGPSTENIYDSPWFPECSVCDELLPPPERDSANAGNQNDQWPSQPKLRAAPRGEECCKMNGTEADCRHCSLTTIPNSLPPEITHLLMGHNAITDKSLSRGAFQRYGQLTLLSLSFNLITSLADGIFEGMPSLRCLCLQFNNIKMDNTLNSSLAFQPLAGSLVYLRLNGFNKNTTNINLMYPSYALSFLSKLKYLFIDGIPFAKFENPQRLLTNLTHLGMLGFRSGYCNLTGLQSNAFEFDTLTHLNISDCNLQGSYVNRSAFENLQSLHSLTISNNFQLGIQTVGEMMGELKGLTHLKLDNMWENYGFPYVYPTNVLSNCAGDNILRSGTVSSSGDEDPYIKSIPVPPNLSELSMYGNELMYSLNNMSFSKNNNLKIVNLSLNIFHYLDGPIKGLEKVQTLEMKLCLIKNISCKFFLYFHGLQNLVLAQNDLAVTLDKDHDGCIFENLTRLTSLDLALNDIYRLNSKSFKSLTNLQYLNISQNRLQRINFSISHMANLKTLDLQKNQIQSLSHQTRIEIDKISEGRQPPLVNLSYNPISCDCENLEFLEWLSDKVLADFDFRGAPYYCGMELQANGYQAVLVLLRRRCIQQQVLFAVVISATMIAVLAIAAVLAYRFR